MYRPGSISVQAATSTRSSSMENWAISGLTCLPANGCDILESRGISEGCDFLYYRPREGMRLEGNHFHFPPFRGRHSRPTRVPAHELARRRPVGDKNHPFGNLA